MLLSRRALLLAAPWLPVRPARAAARLESVGEGMAAVTGPAIRQPLLLPDRNARMLATLACGGEVLTVAAFAQTEGEALLEWAALALAQDGAMVLLALEPLAWRGADGAHMATRLAATGDRSGVVCRRDTAIRASPTLWKREAWTDHLRWNPPGALADTPGRPALADAPVRPAPAGTRQHAVAQWRRRAAAVVAGNPAAITPELLAGAGLQAANFSLAVNATPSMRQPSGRRIMV